MEVPLSEPREIIRSFLLQLLNVVDCLGAARRCVARGAHPRRDALTAKLDECLAAYARILDRLTRAEDAETAMVVKDAARSIASDVVALRPSVASPAEEPLSCRTWTVVLGESPGAPSLAWHGDSIEASEEPRDFAFN